MSKRRVEASVLDQDGPWVYAGWWVAGCEHNGPEREFDNWREAIDHALTCGRDTA